MLIPKFQVNVRSQTIGPIQTCLLLFFWRAFFYFQTFYLLLQNHGLYCEYDNLTGNVPAAQQFSISYEPIYFLDLVL